MAIYLRKTKAEILREALGKLENKTSISATSPGSIARAFTEAITTELGDIYDAFDFQVTQSVASSASGRALDLIGDLYNIKRRTINEIAAIDKKLGSFYFYIEAAQGSNITIPQGTEVYTSTSSFVGRQLRFKTTEENILRAGETRVFASIVPDFGDAIFSAAPNTLVVHSFVSPPGVIVRCVNPKTVSAQEGFESDDNYRIRIIKQVRVASGGTLDAVRFTALAVPGVRDAKIQEQVYGLGSFRLIVTPEDVSFTSTGAADLRSQLERVRPCGVRMFIIQPNLLPVDISATVMLKNATQFTTEVLSRNVSIAIKRYLNSLLSGDTLVYNRLVQYILDASINIADVQFTKYAPNGVEALRRNYTPKAEEMLIPGRIEISMATL